MRRLLAIAFLVTACSSSSGGVGSGSVPAATEVPLTTAAPWPAAYEDKVCSALVQLEGAGDDLVELAAAAEELDVERVSLMAYAAGGYFLGVQTTLIDTPGWTPQSGSGLQRRDLRQPLPIGHRLPPQGDERTTQWMPPLITWAASQMLPAETTTR